MGISSPSPGLHEGNTRSGVHLTETVLVEWPGGLCGHPWFSDNGLNVGRGCDVRGGRS
jgi:hypothetical protein